MTALSSALEAMANGIAMFETSGAVLTPEATQSIARFLRTATDDARKLERMLERRLTSEHIPPAEAAAVLPPPISDKVVPFRRLASRRAEAALPARPAKSASVTVTAIPIAVKPQEPPQ